MLNRMEALSWLRARVTSSSDTSYTSFVVCVPQCNFDQPVQEADSNSLQKSTGCVRMHRQQCTRCRAVWAVWQHLVHDCPRQVVNGRMLVGGRNDAKQAGVMVVGVESLVRVAQLVCRHRLRQGCTTRKEPKRLSSAIKEKLP